MASIIKVDTIQTAAGGTPTAADLGLNTTGSVLQTVSTFKNDEFSRQGNSEADITGMNVTITPSSTSSKILILVSMTVSSGQISGCSFNLKRGDTAIGVGTGSQTAKTFAYDGGGSDSNRATTVHFHYLDSPSSTSALTYKITLEMFNASNTFRLNRNGSAGGQSYDDNFGSSITAMEIAG